MDSRSKDMYIVELYETYYFLIKTLLEKNFSISQRVIFTAIAYTTKVLFLRSRLHKRSKNADVQSF